MLRLDGDVVLVTGAGRGLGRAYARLLADMIAEHGRIDALVHNAGIVRYNGITETTVDVWQRTPGDQRRRRRTHPESVAWTSASS